MTKKKLPGGQINGDTWSEAALKREMIEGTHQPAGSLTIITNRGYPVLDCQQYKPSSSEVAHLPRLNICSGDINTTAPSEQ